MPNDISTESVAVAAPETPAFNAEDTSTWSSEQKQEWQDTGKITAPPKKDAESAAAPTSGKKTAVSEPKGKSAAESGAAKPQEKEKPGKPTADDRIGELTGTIKRMEAEMAELRKGKPVETPKQAAAPAEPPKRPNPFTWTGTPEEFDKAMDAYDAHIRRQAVMETQQSLEQQQIAKQSEEMLKKAGEKYPDAEPKIKATATKLMTDAPPFVNLFVEGSEVLADLLYTLSDEATRANLIETAKTNPGKALRVLRDMERDIEQALKKPDAAVQAKPEKESPAKPEPRAPKTPPEVGGRGSAVEDPAKAAARSGNFSAFDEQMKSRYRAGA